LSNEIRSYRDLIAWQKAFEVGKRIYGITASFPVEERFGLTMQLRRGSISIASNIAEGYGRGSAGDYSRFLKIARGALYELDTQMLFAVDLHYMKIDVYEEIKLMIDEVERVLAGLIRSIR